METKTLTYRQAVDLAERHVARGDLDKARTVYSLLAADIARKGDSDNPRDRLAWISAAMLAMAR